MNTHQSAGPSERVAGWPRITATVRPDGTGSLTINGTEHPCRATSPEELRTGMVARCVALASYLRRPVRVQAIEDGHTWLVAVRPEGLVQPIDEDNTIDLPDGLTVQQGLCRHCHGPQPVTAQHCDRCDVKAPLAVEVTPFDGVSKAGPCF